MVECQQLIKAHLAEVKEKEGFEIKPDLSKFAMLILLHIKPLLNKLKLFKEEK